MAPLPDRVLAFDGVLPRKMIAGSDGGLYKYRIETDDWVQLQGSTCIRYSGPGARGCAINKDVFLIIGDSLGICINLPPTKNFNPNNTSNHEDSGTIALPLLASCWAKFPDGFQTDFLEHHTITKVACNNVMVVGGWINNSVSNRVFQGKLEVHTNDLIWTELKPLRTARMSHITFKMKDDVYVAGGYGTDGRLLCCECNNIKENEWHKHKYSLPCPLANASVVVSDDETFAVITGGTTQWREWKRVIIFTEQTGFELMTRKLLNTKSSHVSILL